MRVVAYFRPRRTGAGLLLITLTLLLATAAQAAWTEGERRILSLDEALAHLGPGWSSELPGHLPVLLPAGLEPGDPKAMDLALALSGFALGSRPEGRHITRPPFSEAQGAERRRLSIFPVTPRGEGAIDNGGLLAYGQFIEGPYRVDVDGEEVRINDVTVFPSPGIEVPLPTISPEQAAHQGLIDAAWNRHRENRLFHDEASAREAFRAECETWPDTESTRWIHDELLLQVRTNGEEIYFGFGDRGRDEPVPDREAARQEMLRVMAEGLEKALEGGHTVVAGASYLFTYSKGSPESLRARAEEIRGGGESDLLKLARLQARLGRREAAADLLWAR